MSCDYDKLEEMGKNSLSISKKYNKNEWCQILLNYASTK